MPSSPAVSTRCFSSGAGMTAPVGFAGPIGLAADVRLVADRSLEGAVDFACGANQADAHWVGVRFGRDLAPPEFADFLLVAAGDPCPRCDGALELYRGIEVGHIFKLGTKYSSAMKCLFTDDAGRESPMIMGCYGLGIGRTVAAAIEQNHDADGIVWPLPVAPFEVLITQVNAKDAATSDAAGALYDALVQEGVEVLLDDRDERPGVKFKDADLIGIPYRVTVGPKGLAEGKVEIVRRRTRTAREVDLGKAARSVAEAVFEERSFSSQI